MHPSSRSSPELQLGQTLREHFVTELDKVAYLLGDAVQLQFSTSQEGSFDRKRETPEDRENRLAFDRARPLWVNAIKKEWRSSLKRSAAQSPAKFTEFSSLQLVSAESQDNTVLASRLSRMVQEKVHLEFDDLRVRMKRLESLQELDGRDVFRAEVLIGPLVEQWFQSGMSREAWSAAETALERALVEQLNAAYRTINALLISKDVLATIELEDRLGRPVLRGTAGGDSRPDALAPPEPQVEAPLDSPAAPQAVDFAPARAMYSAPARAMAADATPQERARGRAQDVLEQVKKFFVNQGGGTLPGTGTAQVSPRLAQALAPRALPPVYSGSAADARSPAGVARVADGLREQSAALKKAAATQGERATIEIVTLMFQAILAEERIPPSIRLWFARLQMPVLRVALADPDFFASPDHPARLLIDRMGSCVMGFDDSTLEVTVMAAEVKRVVQVIEQYPETGAKVFTLVYKEFQEFLEKFLSEKGSNQVVASVAQQVEKKETLAIQFTIELRKLLEGAPVPDQVREYLFKVWAEVLALAALRKGLKHSETLMFKRSATDLVWAAGDKPDRADRARVIDALPDLLARLRSGMTMIGVAPEIQEAHALKITDALAQAFRAKTLPVPANQLDALAQRFNSLEEFVSKDEEEAGQMPLNAQSIATMLGSDASAVDVLADDDAKPTPAMLLWAGELPLGSWYTLNYGGRVEPVQLVWRSEKKHFNLFGVKSGRSFLIQSKKTASLLQGGLLTPGEEETITLRATRVAVTQLQSLPDIF